MGSPIVRAAGWILIILAAAACITAIALSALAIAWLLLTRVGT